MRRILIISMLLITFITTANSSVMASQRTYTVKAGDNLWNISRSNGVSVESIKKLNNLSSDLLHIGQLLSLSKDIEAVAKVKANVEPSAATVANTVNTCEYIVQAGDSLWSIAVNNSSSVEKIMKINNLDSQLLHPGDRILLDICDEQPIEVSRSAENIDGVRIVECAAQYLGTPYVYGGTSPSGFDCSGFVQYIFRKFNIELSRTAAAQYGSGVEVLKDNLKPGDLVFFKCYGGSSINHVGIYAGNGQFIHSSSPRSGGVIYTSLSESFYNRSYAGAKRVIR